MRIDKYLFEKNLAKSRSYAQTMITEGVVYCNGKQVAKPSFEVNENDHIEIRGEILRYVSRGGLKLEGALKSFQIDVNGLICADIGASTGGFTDCLIQHGAKKVYAIDSGSSQLHASLLNDPRVTSMENCNMRYFDRNAIAETCDLAVCDVSFISQTLLHGKIASLLKDGGYFITLIKPQFEVGKNGIGKGGIVKSDELRKGACERVIESCRVFHLSLVSLIDSPIEGGDGNHEYLALFRYHNR